MNTGTVYRFFSDSQASSTKPQEVARGLVSELNSQGMAADTFELHDYTYVVTGPLGLEHQALKKVLSSRAMEDIDETLAQKHDLYARV